MSKIMGYRFRLVRISRNGDENTVAGFYTQTGAMTLQTIRQREEKLCGCQYQIRPW